jgi:hypothetical protein
MAEAKERMMPHNAASAMHRPLINTLSLGLTVTV